MTVGKAIYYLLTNATDVTDIVSTRIYPEIAQQDAGLPYIVYNVANNEPTDTKPEPSKLDTAQVEVNIYSDSYTEAIDLAVAVRAALDRVKGTYNGVNVQSIQYLNEIIDFDEPQRAYNINADYDVRISRTDFEIAQGSPITGVQLGELSDVDVDGVTNGQLIAYNNGVWEAADDAGGAETIGALNDVSITTPADREALIYDGGNWVNDNISKSDVGLGNVDNTSDADKPVSSATQTALDAKADTSAVPTELNDLSDVTIAGTPAGNEALIYDTATSSFKSLPNFTNRFEDEAENNKQSIVPFAERVYTVKADGDGIFVEAQSDTPSSGKVIERKIYHKAGFLESGDVIGDFTLIHEFADDTAYSATTSTFEGFRDGDTYGSPPFTLIQTWEEVDEATEFLDSYPNAEVAYSLRKLSSTYTGNAIQVRRDSDNTTQDIGFDGNGDLDETALLAFVGSGSGYVSIFYDQSGNGRNATQPTTSVQPRIVSSGTVDKINSKPAIYFDNSNSNRFGRDSWPESGKAHFSIFHVVQHYNILGDQTYYSWETSRTWSQNKFLRLSDSANANHNVDWSDPAINTPYIKSACVNGTSGAYDSYINGAQDANGTFSSYSGAFSTNTGQRHGIGYRTNTSAFLRGYIQEMVVYFTDQTSNQSAMQTAINDYYSVY